MECNKRNLNIPYAIFRDSNLKKLTEYLVLQSNIFLYFCDRFSKLKMFFSLFWTVIFYSFCRFIKTKCRTFLKTAHYVSRVRSWLCLFMGLHEMCRCGIGFLDSCYYWVLNKQGRSNKRNKGLQSGLKYGNLVSMKGGSLKKVDISFS